MSEDYSPSCEKGSGTSQACDLVIPESIFYPESEKKLMPDIPLDEMHLSRSLAFFLIRLNDKKFVCRLVPSQK